MILPHVLQTHSTAPSPSVLFSSADWFSSPPRTFRRKICEVGVRGGPVCCCHPAHSRFSITFVLEIRILGVPLAPSACSRPSVCEAGSWSETGSGCSRLDDRWWGCPFAPLRVLSFVPVICVTQQGPCPANQREPWVTAAVGCQEAPSRTSYIARPLCVCVRAHLPVQVVQFGTGRVYH